MVQFNGIMNIHIEAISTIHFQNFLTFQTEILYPLNTTSS